jgi:DNA-binding response OmpR family regulator
MSSMATSHGSKAVLCIGTDFVNLNLRSSLLQGHGWRVLTSGRGYDGVLRFSEESVDAVVLDLGEDGSEAALIMAELKRQRKEVPIVMLITDGRIVVPGATAQADAVLQKSEEARLLHQTLKSLLQVA